MCTLTIGDPKKTELDEDDILENYQVDDDVMTVFPEGTLGILVMLFPGIQRADVTQAEADVLNDLSIEELNELNGLREQAAMLAEQAFPGTDPNDGHADAFRHAYFNAILTNHISEEFAEELMTAHEGVPGNYYDREAMDLYNNEVGRKIAQENPDATFSELAELVAKAISDGETVVIDKNGEIAFSDKVKVGDHGTADDKPPAACPSES